ncbi:hypothetical protein KUTeg_017985 [Tegillarca granosa]|uniref:THAP-type domain-containing protein n=1 Tax=Tegillarca granosa TaxID=220873 RepID=A0ABQ9EGI4_TEGGR|nr:hypothetical protein KUTeg_017985 [Tegillarca granosa]
MNQEFWFGLKQKLIVNSKQHCCVPLCTFDARYNPNLNFHHIPKDPDITPSTVVCSKHFKPEDYKSWTPVRKVLNKNAIPSIFDWSKEGNTRRALKRKIVETVSGSLVGDIAIQPSESTSKSSDSMTLAIQDNFGSEEQEKDRKIHELLKQVEMKTKECDALKSPLQLEKFGVNHFSFDNSMIRFYSGTLEVLGHLISNKPKGGLRSGLSPVMCPQEAEVPIGHVQFADLMETVTRFTDFG